MGAEPKTPFGSTVVLLGVREEMHSYSQETPAMVASAASGCSGHHLDTAAAPLGTAKYRIGLTVSSRLAKCRPVHFKTIS